MMLFRVDFFDNGILAHTLSIESGLDNIKISADKIAGDNYFAKEPKRLEFDHPADDWIRLNIMTDVAEVVRMILKYEVRAYKDNVLVFTGIIDASFLEYDERYETVSFVCYDRIKLLSVFSDLKMLYSLVQGYNPGYCMGYLVQGIENITGMGFPSVWSDSYSNLSLSISQVEILKINWKEILDDIGTFSSANFSYGFCINADKPELRFMVEVFNNKDNLVKVRIFAKKWIFYNNVCPYEDSSQEIDEESDWLSPDGAISFSDKCLVNWNDPLYGSIVINGNAYYTQPLQIWDDITLTTAPDYKTVLFTGNPIPVSLYPKGFYDGNNEQMEKLKVLKTALLLHNLTILSDPQGVVTLTNLSSSSGNTYNIDKNIITEFKIKRVNRSKPDLDLLDCLMGDTAILKECLIGYYDQFFTGKWELTVTLWSDDLNLALNDILVIEGINYKIISIRPDLNGFSEIIAWKV